MSQGILAFAEQREGSLKKAALEACSTAMKIKAELGGDVTAVVIGKNIQDIAKNLGAYGADHVLVFDQDNFEHYSTGGYGRALLQAIKKVDPASIIVPATTMGKDLGAYIAAKLPAGLAADCVEYKVEDGALAAARPVYAGKAMSWVHAAAGPLILGIRPNVFGAEETSPGNEAPVSVEPLDFSLDNIRAMVKEIAAPENAVLDVTEADIVVAGGRGLGSAEGFLPLEELAQVLGQRWVLPVPPLMPAGVITPPRSDKLEKWLLRNSTSLLAFPVPSSTWQGCARASALSPLTKTLTLRYSRSLTTVSLEISSKSSPP